MSVYSGPCSKCGLDTDRAPNEATGARTCQDCYELSVPECEFGPAMTDDYCGEPATHVGVFIGHRFLLCARHAPEGAESLSEPGQ